MSETYLGSETDEAADVAEWFGFLRDLDCRAAEGSFSPVGGEEATEQKQYRLVIRPTDSIWPVKLAEICTLNANRYVELEPVNAHLMYGPRQWRDLKAGDEIHLPPAWTARERQRGRDKGYLILPDDDV